MASPGAHGPPPRTEEYPSDHRGYELLQRIGNGAFADVHKARVISSGEEVAIKIINLEGISSDMEDIRKEVATLRLCQHSNVLRFHCSFVEANNLWLVTQLMRKGSCLHVMSEAHRMGLGQGMKEEWLAWVLHETLLALKYFHDQNQIHRDIKAGNILLDGDGKVVLADFGVSRWVNKSLPDEATSGGAGKAKTFVGTPCWMAPEVMEQLDGYDYKADIWSFGITALELAKGQAPYANHPPMKVLLYTIKHDPPSLKTYPDDRDPTGEVFSQAFKQMTRMCLQKDPARRPTCAGLLSQPFFKKVRTPETLVRELLTYVEDVSSPPRTDEGGSQASGSMVFDEMTGMPTVVGGSRPDWPEATAEPSGDPPPSGPDYPAATAPAPDAATATATANSGEPPAGQYQLPDASADTPRPTAPPVPGGGGGCAGDGAAGADGRDGGDGGEAGDRRIPPAVAVGNGVGGRGGGGGAGTDSGYFDFKDTTDEAACRQAAFQAAMVGTAGEATAVTGTAGGGEAASPGVGGDYQFDGVELKSADEVAAEERAKVAKDQAANDEVMNNIDDMANKLGFGEDYQPEDHQRESEREDEEPADAHAGMVEHEEPSDDPSEAR